MCVGVCAADQRQILWQNYIRYVYNLIVWKIDFAHGIVLFESERKCFVAVIIVDAAELYTHEKF